MDARRAAQGASTTLGVLAATAAARRLGRSSPLTPARMSGTPGGKAQHAVWGQERPESSMLAQLAKRTA